MDDFTAGSSGNGFGVDPGLSFTDFFGGGSGSGASGISNSYSVGGQTFASSDPFGLGTISDTSGYDNSLAQNSSSGAASSGSSNSSFSINTSGIGGIISSIASLFGGGSSAGRTTVLAVPGSNSSAPNALSNGQALNSSQPSLAGTGTSGSLLPASKSSYTIYIVIAVVLVAAYLYFRKK